MSKLTKSILKLDHTEVSDILTSIVGCTNEQFDTGLQGIAKEVIAGYALGVITDEQRDLLTKYKDYKHLENMGKLEKYLFEKMSCLEQETDPTYIFQGNRMIGRIVVASIKEEINGAKTTRKCNGEILEIYKSQTPKAYGYATSKYQEYKE